MIRIMIERTEKGRVDLPERGVDPTTKIEAGVVVSQEKIKDNFNLILSP